MLLCGFGGSLGLPNSAGLGFCLLGWLVGCVIRSW